MEDNRNKIRIYKNSNVKGRAACIWSDAELLQDWVVMKATEERITIQRMPFDFRGKVIKPNANPIKDPDKVKSYRFSAPLHIPTGDYEMNEDESHVDLLVFDREE